MTRSVCVAVVVFAVGIVLPSAFGQGCGGDCAPGQSCCQYMSVSPSLCYNNQTQLCCAEVASVVLCDERQSCCRVGYGATAQMYCCPSGGSQCCVGSEEGGCCPAGSTCCLDSTQSYFQGCAPPGSVCCPGGQCPVNTTCCGPNCCPPEQECCGNSCCGAEQICDTKTDTCLPSLCKACLSQGLDCCPSGDGQSDAHCFNSTLNETCCSVATNSSVCSLGGACCTAGGGVSGPLLEPGTGLLPFR
jgi:hypothetical protein